MQTHESEGSLITLRGTEAVPKVERSILSCVFILNLTRNKPEKVPVSGSGRASKCIPATWDLGWWLVKAGPGHWPTPGVLVWHHSSSSIQGTGMSPHVYGWGPLKPASVGLNWHILNFTKDIMCQLNSIFFLKVTLWYPPLNELRSLLNAPSWTSLQAYWVNILSRRLEKLHFSKHIMGFWQTLVSENHCPTIV